VTEASQGRVILALPPRFDAVSRIRSTLIMSSLAAVRDGGHATAYFAALPAEHHPAIKDAVAGAWLPIAIGIAHYNACEALGLSVDEQLALGRGVGDRVRGTLLGTTTRMAKEAGVTPWTVLPHLQRFWNRAFDGGAITIVQLGPKDAGIEAQKSPLSDVRYFRTALRGLLTNVLEMFCAKAYIKERPGHRPPGTVRFRAQWA
jgi:hypothetical protein